MTSKAAPAPPPQCGASATFAITPDTLIRHVAFTAVGIEIALVLFDLFFNYALTFGPGPIRRLFNITREDALATWFSTSQTLLIALTLCVICALVRRRSHSKLSRRGWVAVTVFFFYMAIDDGAKIHERVGSTLGNIFEGGSGGDDSWLSRLADAFPSYNWQLFIMPIFAVAGALMFLFLWRELGNRRSRVLLLVAMTCLATAVGLDFVQGVDEEHPWNLHAQLDRGLELDLWAEKWFEKSGFAAVVHFSKSVEEFLEMLANTLLWVVFLRHLTALSGELRLRFD